MLDDPKTMMSLTRKGDRNHTTTLDRGTRSLDAGLNQACWVPSTRPANIAMLDGTGTIRAVNDAWRGFAEANAYQGETFGIGDNYLSICRAAAGQGSETAAQVADGLERLLSGEISLFTMEYPCHAPDEKRWFQLIAFRDPSSRGERIIVMHLPVTERHQAEEALIRARREAEAANTAKSRFLAAVSHDLRQPVQAAMLFYHLLPVDLDSGGPGNVYRRLGQQLEAMQDMLNRLLDVSKLEAGLVDASIRAFPVREMFDRLRGDFNQLVGDRPVQLRMVDCAAWVRTDPELLHLILHNVLANAIDHTPRGVILVGCRRRGADIRIQVCDTGGGIPESAFPHRMNAVQIQVSPKIQAMHLLDGNQTFAFQ